MDIEIVAGSYSHLIFGYFVKPNEEQKLKFSLSFTNDSHAGCVKSMAINSNGILASGSSDESIQLLRLKGKRTEIGSLREHSGTITALKFHSTSHLFSSGEDGQIIVWKTGSWEIQKVLKHKRSVVDFAIHPSGKLLLSTCKDRTLQTWNLVSGKRAFIVNLKDVGEHIQFSNDGEMFVVDSITYASVYRTSTAEVIDTITPSSKIASLVFFKPNVLFLGLENGTVLFYDIKKSKQIFELNTKTKRVKSMSVLGSQLVVASSDGYIKLYKVEMEGKDKVAVTFITGIVAAQRWLCMSAFQSSADSKNKKKMVAKEEDKKEDDETKDEDNEDEVEDDEENDEEDDEDDDDDDVDDEDEDDDVGGEDDDDDVGGEDDDDSEDEAAMEE